MGYYDPVQGWVGLQGHETTDFSALGSSEHRRQRILAYLEVAGMDFLHGSLDETAFVSIRFDLFLVSRIATPRMAVCWTRRFPVVRKRVLFLMVTRGSLEVRGEDPFTTSADGSLTIVFPGSAPMVIEAREPTEFLLFSFDESAVSQARLRPENVRELSPASCVFQTTFTYLRSLIGARSVTSIEESPAMRVMVRAMAQALTEVAMHSDAQSDVYSRAQRLIADEGDNPELGATQIAERLGVSRRTLFRAFSEKQTTVTRELAASRSNRVFETLRRDPRIPAGRLAERCGFASERSLQRAVKEVFGSTVSALRASV